MSYSKTPPMTAPVTFTSSGVPQYGGVPQWRTIYYGQGDADEKSPLRGNPPLAPPSEFKPRRPSPPSLGFFRPANVYPPPPPQLQIFAPAPDAYTGNPYAQRAIVSGQGARKPSYAAYDSIRDVMRGPLPGPASEHQGGWRSAYHTPLPSAIPGGLGNSWRDERVGEGGARENGGRPELRTERSSAGGRLVFPEAERSRRYY